MSNPMDEAAASPAPALPESGVEGALREALTEIAKQKLHREITDSDPDELDWLGGFEACVMKARAALATPAPAPAPATAPVDAAGLVARLVKPLEWQRWPEDGSECSEGQGEKRFYRQRALHPNGAYFLMWKDGAYSVKHSIGGEDLKGMWLEADIAKAAAQADYTARILSALDASALAAAAEREAALVRERARWEAVAETAWATLDKQATSTVYSVIGGQEELPAHMSFYNALEAAEARVTAAEAERDAEREACARIVDDWTAQHAACVNDDGPSPAGRHRVAVNDGRDIAAAIRNET